MPKYVDQKLVQEYNELSEKIKDRRETVFSKREVSGSSDIQYEHPNLLEERAFDRHWQIDEMRQVPRKRERR